MNVVKTLWASVQGDPVFMRRVNGWLTIFWVVMIPISAWAGWLHSVVFVSALSLWALVPALVRLAGRRVSHPAAAAERHRREPIEECVVDQLIQRTSIEQTHGTRIRSPKPSTSRPC